MSLKGVVELGMVTIAVPFAAAGAFVWGILDATAPSFGPAFALMGGSAAAFIFTTGAAPVDADPIMKFAIPAAASVGVFWYFGGPNMSLTKAAILGGTGPALLAIMPDEKSNNK